MRLRTCLVGLPFLLLACGGDGSLASKPQTPLPPTARVLFPAGDLKTGLQLWSSDGTPEGTRMLKEISPRSHQDPTNYAHWAFPNVQAMPFTLWKDRVWFFANDGVHGTEPWSSDGTEAGTGMLMDINPGESHSAIPWVDDLRIPIADDRLWFSAAPSGDSYSLLDHRLWCSDGTAPDTRAVADLETGSPLVFPYWLTPLEQGLACTAQWSLDQQPHFTLAGSTAAGGSQGLQPSPSDLRHPFRLGHDLLFWDTIIGNNHSIGRLWNSGPDGRGRALLLGLEEGSGWYRAPHWSYAHSFREVNGLAFFELRTWPNNRETHSLWRTDGTPSGTFKLMDLAEPTEQIANCTVFFKGRRYFTANDGVHGQELWSTDGTPEGTRLFADLVPGPTGSYPGYSVQHLLCTGGFFVFKEHLYFGADSPWGHVLWRSDGTPEGTAVFADPAGNFENVPCWPAAYAQVGDTLYFSAQALGSTQKQLWRSDGSFEGTRAVTNFDFGKSLNPIWTIVPSPKP